MDYLIQFAITAGGCFVGLYLFVMAGAQGDIGDLLGKCAANVKKRMPSTAFQFASIPMRAVEGSPAFKFSWSDFLAWFRTALLVGLSAMATSITNSVLPNIDQSTMTGAAIASGWLLLFKFLSRWLPNTGK